MEGSCQTLIHLGKAYQRDPLHLSSLDLNKRYQEVSLDFALVSLAECWDSTLISPFQHSGCTPTFSASNDTAHWKSLWASSAVMGVRWYVNMHRLTTSISSRAPGLTHIDTSLGAVSNGTPRLTGLGGPLRVSSFGLMANKVRGYSSESVGGKYLGTPSHRHHGHAPAQHGDNNLYRWVVTLPARLWLSRNFL